MAFISHREQGPPSKIQSLRHRPIVARRDLDIEIDLRRSRDKGAVSAAGAKDRHRRRADHMAHRLIPRINSSYATSKRVTSCDRQNALSSPGHKQGERCASTWSGPFCASSPIKTTLLPDRLLLRCSTSSHRKIVSATCAKASAAPVVLRLVFPDGSY